MTLRPLMLDDIRVAEPDRDNAEAFDPRETWATACDKIGEGYPAADVADVLMQLADDERAALADYWRDHTLSTVDNPAANGRDFLAHDLRVALALQDREPDREAWGCAPTLDPASLWETVVEFDRLQAENAKLRELLADARELVAEWQAVHVWGDDPIAEDCSGTILMREIDEALAGHEAAAPQPQPAPAAETRRIVISVEGGMVTGLSADGPVAAVITDYDTENSDEADLTDIPGTGMGGPPARAGIEFIAAECDPAFVAAVHALGEDDDCPNTQDGKHAYVTRAKDGVCACDTCGKVHPLEGSR